MAGSPFNEFGLTAKQELFVAEYVKNGGNGTAAAKEAGYNKSGAHTAAWNMLRIPKVQSRMETLSRELRSQYVPGCL